MSVRKKKIIGFSSFIAFFCIALFIAGSATAAGAAQPVVELASSGTGNNTFATEFPDQKISGTNSTTRQEYKFQRQREGKNFSYTVANLDPTTSYSVELSFVEHDFSSSSKRIFNAYLQGTKVLSNLDVYANAGGKNRAYQRTFVVITDSDGLLVIWLRSDESGCKDYATVSTIRIYRGSTDVMEISASSSRNNMWVPTRYANSSTQNVYETLLGRLGARYSLNLIPQRLCARLSTLGHGTGDLEDFVIALKSDSVVRALPYTDRFPVWENISQTQTMTTQSLVCSSSKTPFQLTVTMRSPFYPENKKISGAPFTYIDVSVKNTGSSPAGAELMIALPGKRVFANSGIAEFSTANAVGFSYKNVYHYADESISDSGNKEAVEALCVPAGEESNVDFRGSVEGEFTDFDGDTLWGWESPSGYPKTIQEVKYPVFSFYPRGYVGAIWSTGNIAHNSVRTRHFVLAGYTNGKVLRVKNSSYTDNDFRFQYTKQFSNVIDVLSYAVSNRNSGDEIETKSNFFDQTIFSDSYLLVSSAYATPLRYLIAYSFQAFLTNTWWAQSDSGREWWSVWEGTSCRFHSTVDVEYNNVWFYSYFWPELLGKTIDEWVLYKKTNAQGTYLSHDMGSGDYAGGQAYVHDMPVEENANFILVLYKYWKATGDTNFMRSHFSTVRKFVDFLIACDTDGNGLPDVNTSNTLDQSTYALQGSRNQAYLGGKCLGAYIAASEMAASMSPPDSGYIKKCRANAELINQTFAYELWLQDHYAACLDINAQKDDRDAYHIYAENGLLLLLSGNRNPYVYAINKTNMGYDLANVVSKTIKEYGCVHSSFDNKNEWVSQNLWRDSAACMFGVNLSNANPLKMTQRYWNLQKYFATLMNGGYYDVVTYPGWATGYGKGGLSPSEGYPGIKCPPGGISGSSGQSYSAGGYGQFLGYYPRGVSSLGLIDCVSGITLDVPGGALYYKPSTYPLRIPVFERAQWTNSDPQKRIPVLYFKSSSSSVAVSNRNLLPGRLEQKVFKEIGNVTAGNHAISPDGDGSNDRATVSYKLTTGSKVRVSIWKGSTEIKEIENMSRAPGNKSFDWDGKDSSGKVVEDGLYTARIDATPSNTSYATTPVSLPLYVNSSIPDLSKTGYLAEGYTGINETGGEFDEYVLIQNPNPVEANVNFTFMLEGGKTEQRAYVIAAKSRFTIRVDSILPYAEVSTKIESDQKICAERAMYFSGRKAGHDSIGVSQPSLNWYLAEGYTGEDFDEYVLLQNPGENESNTTVTFMTSKAKTVQEKYKIGAHSRFTIHVDDILPNHEVSTRVESSEPIIVERAQYLKYMKAGTCSIGARSLSDTWYLAEGYTAEGFEEWVLIQNPWKKNNEVTVTFMDRAGNTEEKEYSLAPESRFTIPVDQILEASEVSTKVKAQFPVLVERAMYWNERSDGHASIGTPTPDSEWYLSEGYTADGFETWVLVQNPMGTSANVTMTFMKSNGETIEKKYEVGPRSRYTVNVNEVVPLSEVATKVSADGLIIVERAVYFNGRSGGTDTIGIRGS
ncbi:MAG: malectin domain-containing carbohydrate-binding protein [Actinomycetota bacterium]|nr:malectin domain-containing carbohydrate-binding protein [Actinomycetota bacterium]